MGRGKILSWKGEKWCCQHASAATGLLSSRRPNDSLWSRREKDRLGRSGQAKTEAVLCHLRRLQTGATSPSAGLHWEGTE